MHARARSGVVAVLTLVACGPGGGEVDPAVWPLCEPHAIGISWFQVGSSDWPSGEHAATCTVVRAFVDRTPHVTDVSVHVDLDDCVDGEMVPIARSLDLSFSYGDLWDEATLVSGMQVRIAYWLEIGGPTERHAWYTLRAADTDELLVAAFTGPGPALVPVVSGAPPATDWLAPFTAALGEFVCPPEDDEDCESEVGPQRAAAVFSRGAQRWSIPSGTLGDLGDYAVYLGFAGAPDVCEERWVRNAIEGVLVRK